MKSIRGGRAAMRLSFRATLKSMACQQCDRLASELKAREREYQLALQYLDSAAETAEPNLYQKLKIRASDMRIDCEAARLLIRKHQQDGQAGK